MSQLLFIACSGILVLSNVALVILVLMHRGKGGGLSSMFGGFTVAATSSAYAEKNLNRATIATAAVWASSVIAVGLLVPYL